jgi:hypothetical protein
MNDLYLKTDDEAEMAWALIEAGVWTEDQEPTGVACVDVIGEIPAVLAEDGSVLVPAKDGWHVNLRPMQEMTEAQLSMLPILDPPPANPVRVWF